MIWTDAREVDAIIQRIGPIVLSTAPVTDTTEAALLRRAVGRLLASDNIEYQPFVERMRISLDLARHAGATLYTMGRVRLAALEEVPESLSAVAVVQAVVRLCLAQEARLVSQIIFASRDDVDATFSYITNAFSDAAEAASDALDAATNIAIIRLQADVIKHLTDVGRQLPRVISYRLGFPLPALAFSQRFYQTGDRADEVIRETKVVHPAFMPLTGRILAT